MYTFHLGKLVILLLGTVPQDTFDVENLMKLPLDLEIGTH